MKKIGLLLSVLLLAVAVLSGCAAEAPASTSSAAPETGASAEASAESVEQTGGKDYTVQVKALDTEKFQTQIAQAEVIGSSASYHYDAFTVPIMVQNATDIVRGTVQDVAFTTINGDPYTKLDVKLAEVFKGAFQQNDVISVLLYGGYLTAKEYIESRGLESQFSDLTEKERENTIYEIRDEDTKISYPQIGEEYLLFLRENTLLDNAYSPTTGAFTMYKRDDSGNYIRCSEETDAVDTTKNTKASFTLDWVKAKLQSLAEKAE